MTTSGNVPNFMKELLVVADNLQNFAKETGFSASHPFMEHDFSDISSVKWFEAGVDFVTYLRNAIIEFHSSEEFNTHAQSLVQIHPEISVPRLRRILPNPPPKQEQIKILSEFALNYIYNKLTGETSTDDTFIESIIERHIHDDLSNLIDNLDIIFTVRITSIADEFHRTPGLQRKILMLGCDHYMANRAFQKAYDLCMKCNQIDTRRGEISADVQDRLWYLSFRLGRLEEAKLALQSWMSANPLHKRPLVFYSIIADIEKNRTKTYEFLELSGAHLGLSTVGGNILYAECKMQDGKSLLGESAIRNAIHQAESIDKISPVEYYICLHNMLLKRGIESSIMKMIFERHGLTATWPAFRIDTVTDTTAPRYTSEKKVAVVMTAWNAQAYIQRAIDGVLGQNHSNLVIIIMDDCSDDDTADICLKAEKHDHRVIYIQTSKNMGTYAAKNIGIKHALTLGVDYISLCDSDDFWLSSHVENHLQVMDSDESLSCSTSQWMRIRQDGSVECGLRGRYVETCPHSTFFRADVFKKAGYFDSVRFGADREFLSRIQLYFGRASVRGINKVLTLGRRHSTSLTTSGAGAITEFNESPVRIQYWNSWNEWHTAAVLRGEKPFTEGGVDDRPFPIPREMLSV